MVENENKKLFVFVTVGSTSFDRLIETITAQPMLQTFQRLGYTRLLLQIGRGEYEPIISSDNPVAVDYFRYKDSIAHEIKHADLIISHAGAGSCLEALGENKPIVVVINEDLMNNHQTELAHKLHSDGHLFYSNCRGLSNLLQTMNLSDLKRFTPGRPDRFSSFIDTVMGIAP